MTLKHIRQKYRESLKDLYPKEEIDSMFYLLLEHITGKTRLLMAVEPDIMISGSEENRLVRSLAELMKEYPVQYLIGETEFLGRNFKVSEDVLIPRPETEELVNWIISQTDKKKELKILDIGTGSGCIIISLACALKESVCSATDVSDKALELAKNNAMIHGTDIDFLKQDVLTAKTLPGQFDLIVSNPPYVRQSEKAKMRGNVLKFEPDLALYVEDEDPLLFYRAIAKLAAQSLTTGGSLYFEINQYMEAETKSLLEDLKFSDIVTKKDLFGAPRMIRARKF